MVLTRVHGGRCNRGDWGFDSRRIWVTRNCRATFAYGFGRYYPSRWDSRSSGRDAAFFIGGAAVAAGLIAILSNNGRTIDTSGSQSLPPASVRADPSWVTEGARPALDQCLSRAARDVGLTGGKGITLQTASAYPIEDGAFQISATLNAEYPEGNRELPMLCEATATSVDNFEFTEDTEN